MADNGNVIRMDALDVVQAESFLSKARLQDREHYTAVISKHIFEINRLTKINEELQYIYQYQFHMLNNIGTTQERIIRELHRDVVEPLQLENRQIKQQLLYEQAKLQVGIKEKMDTIADLTLQFDEHFQKEFELARKTEINKLRSEYDKKLSWAVRQQIQQIQQELDTRTLELEDQTAALQAMKRLVKM